MKGLIITVCLLLVLSIAIFLNSLYLVKVHNELVKMTNSLTENPSAENEIYIQKAQAYWERSKIILSLSVNNKEIDNLSNALDSLALANKLGATLEFSLYKELFENAVEGIFRLERFSVENIL